MTEPGPPTAPALPRRRPKWLNATTIGVTSAVLGIIGFVPTTLGQLGVRLPGSEDLDLTPQQHIAQCRKAHQLPEDPLPDPGRTQQTLGRCDWPPKTEATDGFSELRIRTIADPDAIGVDQDAVAYVVDSSCQRLSYTLAFHHMTSGSSPEPREVANGAVLDAVSGEDTLLDDPLIGTVPAPGPRRLILLMGFRYALTDIRCT